VLDQHLTRSEEEEEVAEYKAAFLDALKGLEAARKCMYQFDAEAVLSYEVENELYTLRAQCEEGGGGIGGRRDINSY
jgi:hypothetical protein